MPYLVHIEGMFVLAFTLALMHSPDIYSLIYGHFPPFSYLFGLATSCVGSLFDGVQGLVAAAACAGIGTYFCDNVIGKLFLGVCCGIWAAFLSDLAAAVLDRNIFCLSFTDELVARCRGSAQDTKLVFVAAAAGAALAGVGMTTRGVCEWLFNSNHGVVWRMISMSTSLSDVTR